LPEGKPLFLKRGLSLYLPHAPKTAVIAPTLATKCGSMCIADQRIAELGAQTDSRHAAHVAVEKRTAVGMAPIFSTSMIPAS
jgi:hypothetical protein